MLEEQRIDHLLRRSGFGVTPQERKAAHQRGYRKTLQRLLHKSGTYRLSESPPIAPMPHVIVPLTLVSFGQGVAWWLKTMATTDSPLNERLTMFWHRHFATSGAKVFRPGWMFEQNLTFRRFGTGAFSDLLGKMVEDPALLSWLDADQNPVQSPNENLARELLELFTLGIGNYSEADVKELAKLTTGQRLTLGGKTLPHPRGEYQGPVAVLDYKGQLKLKDVVQRLAVHPATARRMVARLWDDFAASTIPESESARLVDLWMQSRGNVTVVMREIFLSQHFHDAPRQRVNSPVEYWVTCARLLESHDFRLDDAALLHQAGELLYFLPSVIGWDLGPALIHPSALQTRLKIAQRIVSRLPENHFVLRGLARAADPARYLSHVSGGQIRVETLPSDLHTFEPQEALLLALASPDLWLS